MSATTICWRATRFGFTLPGNEFAIDARQHFVDELSPNRRSVMWVRAGQGSLMVGNPARLEDYIALLANQECPRPLCFDTFIKFIFENFDLDACKSQVVAREIAFSHEEDCMSDHDRGRAYLDWTHR